MLRSFLFQTACLIWLCAQFNGCYAPKSRHFQNLTNFRQYDALRVLVSEKDLNSCFGSYNLYLESISVTDKTQLRTLGNRTVYNLSINISLRLKTEKWERNERNQLDFETSEYGISEQQVIKKRLEKYLREYILEQAVKGPCI